MKFLRNLSGKLRNLPKRTQVLITVLLGLAIVAVGVFIWGYSTGAISSSASSVDVTPIAGRIEGQVEDSANKKIRIEGASASAKADGPTASPGDSTGSAKTEKDGVFKITNMASGKYNVTVTATGYETYTTTKTCKFYKASGSVNIPIKSQKAGGNIHIGWGGISIGGSQTNDRCNLGEILLKKITAGNVSAFAKDKDSGDPISGVSVTSGSKSCTTGDEGRCPAPLLTGAGPNTYTATFKKTGYKDATSSCTISTTEKSCEIVGYLSKDFQPVQPTETGTLSGKVKVSGVVLKCDNPDDCVVFMTLNLVSAGTSSNVSGLVNNVGYLIKGKPLPGSSTPQYIRLPAGTYTTTTLTLTYGNQWGRKTLNGTPVTFTIAGGERTDPNWLFDRPMQAN